MIAAKQRSNTELIAREIGNIGSGLFGGIPATGAIAKPLLILTTAAEPRCWNGSCSGTTVNMLLFMPLAELISCILSGVLIVVAYNMSEGRNLLLSLKPQRVIWLYWL
jgi:SulP family sulfate permease